MSEIIIFKMVKYSCRRYRRRRGTRNMQTLRAKISTITKVAYPGFGNEFAFGLSGNKLLNLAGILSNCADWDHYRKIFNVARVYAVRLQANYVHRADYIHNFPVAIALLPNSPGANDVTWNDIRSADSCLMLNNTSCKMFRRLYNSKLANNYVSTSEDTIFVVGSEAKPGDNMNGEWNIKVDVYIKFYGLKF